MIQGLLTHLYFFAAATCDNTFLLLPAWHNGLPRDSSGSNPCGVIIEDFDNIWLIAANIVQALLGIGVYVSIAFAFYGAFLILVSSGSAERVKSGKDTILNAVIGLVICLVSAFAVGAILGTFK